jgi:hypothetical protein
MPEDTPHIVLSYRSTIPPQVFSPLLDSLAAPHLSVRVDAREPEGPQAGLEWLLPTAAIVYLTKSYFDGFLREAGKEHYQAFKKGIASLWSSFFGSDRTVRMHVVASTPGKLPPGVRYSWALFLMADGASGTRFKLLLSDATSPAELDLAVLAFLEFLAECHAGHISEPLRTSLASVHHVGGLALLTYDLASASLRVVDARGRREGDEGA